MDLRDEKAVAGYIISKESGFFFLNLIKLTYRVLIVHSRYYHQHRNFYRQICRAKSYNGTLETSSSYREGDIPYSCKASPLSEPDVKLTPVDVGVICTR